MQGSDMPPPSNREMGMRSPSSRPPPAFFFLILATMLLLYLLAVEGMKQWFFRRFAPECSRNSGGRSV